MTTPEQETCDACNETVLSRRDVRAGQRFCYDCLVRDDALARLAAEQGARRG